MTVYSLYTEVIIQSSLRAGDLKQTIVGREEKVVVAGKSEKEEISNINLKGPSIMYRTHDDVVRRPPYTIYNHPV